MAQDKSLIECKADSDVYYFLVGAKRADKVVTLAVADRETTKDIDDKPLIVAQLLPSQAIRLAQALLAAAVA